MMSCYLICWLEISLFGMRAGDKADGKDDKEDDKGEKGDGQGDKGEGKCSCMRT